MTFFTRPARAAWLGAVSLCAVSPLAAQKPSANLHEVWSAISDSGLFASPRSLVVTSDCTVWIGDPLSGVWRLSCNFGGAPLQVETDSAGPHHLQLPWLVAGFRGDTVAVWDRTLQTVALFAPGGTFVRALPLRLVEAVTGRPFGVLLPLADGSARAWTTTYPGGPGGRKEHRTYVLSIRPDGAVKDSLVAVEGPESVFYDTAGFAGEFDAPLQRKPFVSFFHDGGFIVGNNQSPRVDLFSAAGKKQRTITLPLPVPGRVTTADRAAFLDSARRSADRAMESRHDDDSLRVQFRQVLATLLHDVVFPETRQYYDQLLLDEKENTVWALLPGTGATYTRTWMICSLTELSFCRTQTIPLQGAIVAVAIHGGAVYTIEQTRDGISRVAKYDSQ